MASAAWVLVISAVRRVNLSAAEKKRIYETYKARALTAFDWCPTGKYFNLDHLPIPDHQKDIFRIVAYVIDPDGAYKKKKPTFAPDNQAVGARVFFTDGTATPMNYGVLKPEEEWTEDDHELKGGSRDNISVSLCFVMRSLVQQQQHHLRHPILHP